MQPCCYSGTSLLQVADENPQPAKDPDTLAAAGKWMECEAFVKLMHNIEIQSQAWWRKTGSLTQAREVHDSTLACVMITHLPPMRLSMIRSMLYSDPAEACTACEHADCKLAECEGNRLYVESTSPLRLRMKFPHHKNDNKWKRAVIEFIVPEDLAELLHMYLSGPRKQLMRSTGSTTDRVFMDLQGRPFHIGSSFCCYWQRFMVNHGAPALNPSICRQIFVAERMSDGAAAGPSDRGAAMIMGHSVKQWHDWYDLKFHSRLAQNAVNAMQEWRHSLLDARPVQQYPAPRRRAQIVYTDSDSDEQPVQQPSSTAASQQQQQQLSVAAPQPTQEITTATTSHQPSPLTCEGHSAMPIVISSDSDSDVELLV